MRRKRLTMLLLILGLGCVGIGNSTQREAPRMTKEQLKARLGLSDQVLIDVRSARDWMDSDLKIAGAVRESPEKFDEWKNKYPKSRTLLLYCA
jgi:rhodanese-related sulfurtransferase